MSHDDKLTPKDWYTLHQDTRIVLGLPKRDLSKLTARLSQKRQTKGPRTHMLAFHDKKIINNVIRLRRVAWATEGLA